MASTVDLSEIESGGSGVRLVEQQLAYRAAAGDGAAFAELYDRYERRIFSFCQRLCGSVEDAADATQEAFVKVLQRLPKLAGREVNFSAYLYTAARNSCYDLINKRKRSEPVGEIPESPRPELGDLLMDPERAAMLTSQRIDIQEANHRLPERQREVLVLREVEGLSYDEIAEVMSTNRNTVAQLISRARINLRNELRGGAVSSIVGKAPDCERALPLLAMYDDRQLKDREQVAWLEGHLSACETCRASQASMQEAGVSYRAWAAPIAGAVIAMRDATIAHAGEVNGYDWSAWTSTGSSDAGSSAGHTETVSKGVATGSRSVSRVAAFAAGGMAIAAVAVLIFAGSVDEASKVELAPASQVATLGALPVPKDASPQERAAVAQRNGAINDLTTSDTSKSSPATDGSLASPGTVAGTPRSAGSSRSSGNRSSNGLVISEDGGASNGIVINDDGGDSGSSSSGSSDSSSSSEETVVEETSSGSSGSSDSGSSNSSSGSSQSVTPTVKAEPDTGSSPVIETPSKSAPKSSGKSKSGDGVNITG